MYREIFLAAIGVFFSALFGYVVNSLSNLTVTKLLVLFGITIVVLLSFALKGSLGDMIKPSRVNMNGKWVMTSAEEGKQKAFIILNIKQKGSFIHLTGERFDNNEKLMASFSSKGNVDENGLMNSRLSFFDGERVVEEMLYVFPNSMNTALCGYIIKQSGDKGLDSTPILLEKKLW